MATQCYPVVQARAARVTRLDACGEVVLGPDSQVTTKGLVEIGITANINEGDEITLTNINGDQCVRVPPKPELTGFGLEIQLCNVDPDLISLLTGQTKVVDENDNVIGYNVETSIDLDDVAFALEVWGKVPAAQCEPGAGQQYAYMIFPFVKGGVAGDFTINGTDAVTFTITNATTYDGANWGVGPYDVITAAGAPSPLLDPISATTHQRTLLTTLAPPTDQCGAQEVGTLAVSGTEVVGEEGNWEPANSYAPLDPDDANTQGVAETSAATVAWTTGSFITFRDGSVGHWDGTEWVAGVAP